MLKLEVRPVWVAGLFVILQTGIFALFLHLDVRGLWQSSGLVKYTGIIVCLVTALVWAGQGGDWLVAAALGFTLGADTFLLLLGRHLLIGVLLFCVVQAIYLRRILRASGGSALWPIRLCLFGAALWLLWRLGELSWLNAVAALYFSNFVCNAAQSLPLRGRRDRLFSLGLLLFLCCDLCVAVGSAPWIFSGEWVRFAQLSTWMYYLPAQVLITLSAMPPIARRTDGRVLFKERCTE